MPYLMCFGDSNTFGFWDTEGGWVQRVRRMLDPITMKWEDSNYYMVYNLGIQGDTSEDLLKRLDNEVKARKGEERFIFIFGIGSNDANFIHKENKRRIEEVDFRENINTLIYKARGYSNNILFIGPLPVDESKMNPVPWFPGLSIFNKDIKHYNEILKEECDKNSVRFIDIYSDFEKEGTSLLEDGLHPNSKGHELIFEKVKECLIENNLIKL